MKTESEIRDQMNRLEMIQSEQMETHNEIEAEIAGDHMTPTGLRQAADRMDASDQIRIRAYHQARMLRDILAQ